jgi:hypothetical protein
VGGEVEGYVEEGSIWGGLVYREKGIHRPSRGGRWRRKRARYIGEDAEVVRPSEVEIVWR